MDIAKDNSWLKHPEVLVHVLKEGVWTLLSVIVSLGPIVLEAPQAAQICGWAGLSIVGVRSFIAGAVKVHSMWAVKKAMDKTDATVPSDSPIQNVIDEIKAPIQQTPDDLFSKLNINPEQFMAQLSTVAAFIESNKHVIENSGVIYNPQPVTNDQVDQVSENYVYPTVQ